VGLSHFQDELSYLHENNVYFISSYKSGEGFITYAFEKEGSSGDISLLYRAPEVSDDQWLSMPESERMERLKNIKIRLKTFIDSNKIAPTGLKPDALGGYSQELNSATNTSYGWEVSHKKYEINLQRVLREIKDVTKIFKETHSIHAHVAFEIPQNYAEYENFIYWYKHFNDYLYLKGMEEGLHGNDLTSVANMADDMKENNSWGERIQRWIQRWRGIEPLPDPLSQNIVVEKQKDLGATNSKFFSAGLRGKIYGPASEGNAKIGIELRDSTRNLNLLGHYMQSLSVSIQNRIWENSDLALVKKNSLRLTSSAPKALKEIGSLVRPDDARLFAKVEPTVYFGLVHFENMAIYNYKTKTWQQVPPDVRARLQQARAQYEHDLVALQTELEEKKAKGEHVDDELVKLAIRMSLAGWAKQAKASELFENY
jgi:hypothetical protein